ncbi:RBPJ-interacting and tubulin-associated protein 1-like [Rattus norvegicus]|uniref:RBPJ-interacting and tubulin-associated protein 1 n=1 Tax=Rattus norvegicus TaxID=10116 RepID=A0A8I6AAS4_RAT|nr:RBPJ-interacting and tubulin-associated protein 1-like [Rattus norvegicus]
MQALHLHHRSPSSYPVKARASHVDETLFGSPTGTPPSLPDFDPPWVQNCNRSRGVSPGLPTVSVAKRDCESPSSRGSTANLTLRKKNKYRLIGHTPSYCDEPLFGSQPQGTSKERSQTAMEDAAKLQTLFWTPPSTPRGSYSPRPRVTPLRAIHPAGPSRTEPRVAKDSQRMFRDGLDVPRSLGQRRSHSLTHLTIPSTGPWSYTSGATVQSPLITCNVCSGSVSVPAILPRKPKAPWK